MNIKTKVIEVFVSATSTSDLNERKFLIWIRKKLKQRTKEIFDNLFEAGDLPFTLKEFESSEEGFRKFMAGFVVLSIEEYQKMAGGLK